jgi:uncharacterized protein
VENSKMKLFNHSSTKKIVFRTIFILLFFLNLTKLNAQDNDDEIKEDSKKAASFNDELEKTKQLIVMLRVDFDGSQEFGAGIIVGRKKDELLIATAYHVLHRGSIQPNDIKVTFRAKPDKPLGATILNHDNGEGTDWALLSVKDLSKAGIDVCTIPFDRLGDVSTLERGDGVFPVGNPNGIQWGMPVVPDRISDVLGINLSFQSAFIHNGHSGGALLDDSGYIVGMILKDEPPFGLAISIDKVIKEVKQLNYPVQLRVEFENGEGPLHVAANAGDIASIKQLVADCGNINQRDDHQATPLHYAAWMADTNTIKTLVNFGADVNALDADGDPPLQWAIDTPNIENVKMLVKLKTNLARKNNSGKTLLQFAITKGEIEIVKLLVAAGADMNVPDSDGVTPLLATVYSYASFPKSEKYYTNSTSIGDFLITHGANSKGLTKGQKEDFLMDAVTRKNEDVLAVKMLLASGTDPNMVWNQQSILSWASKKGRIESMKALIKSGADVNIDLPTAESPIYCAFEENQVEAVKILLESGVNANAKDPFGEPLLVSALEHAGTSLETIKALVLRGANIYSESKDGQTPLSVALGSGNKPAVEYLIQLLTKAGANVNAQDKSGNSIILQAVQPNAYGSEADKDLPLYVIKILINAGADVNLKNKRGDSPLHIALTNSFVSAADLLRAHGAKE